MAVKFTASWSAVGGSETASVREIGACFDHALALMVAGGGAGVAAVALNNAGNIAAEDDLHTPLHLDRVDPTNPATLGPALLAAVGVAATQLSSQFTSSGVPPTLADASAAWQAAFLVRNATLDNAMAAYLSTAWVGGTGGSGDAPPPPEVPPAPTSCDFATAVVTGQEVQFTDESVGSGIGWTWDFGDNAGRSTAQNPLYTYGAAGTYTVTLTIANGGGSLSASHTVTV